MILKIVQPHKLELSLAQIRHQKLQFTSQKIERLSLLSSN